MFHAGMAAAFADRLVERVVRSSGAEFGDIAGAELADGVTGELEFGDRHEIERAQLTGCALRLGIEAADCFEGVAEKIEADGLIHAGREQKSTRLNSSHMSISYAVFCLK